MTLELRANRNSELKICLVGHPFAPIGRGEDIRCAYRALKTVGSSVALYDIFGSHRGNDPAIIEEFTSHLDSALSTDVNIFFLNGDELEAAVHHLESGLPKSSFNIVYPQWELGKYPAVWARQLDQFDEIWAPSGFVLEALEDAVSKPVTHMPLPVEVRLDSFLSPRYFGLPEGSHTFLFFFDYSSYITRKNPWGPIGAFKNLCEEHPDLDVRLVIKASRLWRSENFEQDRERYQENF